MHFCKVSPLLRVRKARRTNWGLPARLTALLLLAPFSLPGEPPIEAISLPALRIDGLPARAHTQGMEWVDRHLFVTARREDVSPRRALLLRTDLGAAFWDVWDLTPLDAQGNPTAMDHPGGMQSDGARLWIPVAESKRKGRTLIRAYRIADLAPGQPPKPEREIPVHDHVGALAISSRENLMLGASWDTERVYVWDLEGKLRQTLAGADLTNRLLGKDPATPNGTGLAVQDWKWMEGQLFASGVAGKATKHSRLLVYMDFLQPTFRQRSVPLPEVAGVELAQEAMTMANGSLWFLPENLGATNRMFKTRLE